MFYCPFWIVTFKTQYTAAGKAKQKQKNKLKKPVHKLPLGFSHFTIISKLAFSCLLLITASKATLRGSRLQNPVTLLSGHLTAGPELGWAGERPQENPIQEGLWTPDGASAGQFLDCLTPSRALPSLISQQHATDGHFLASKFLIVASMIQRFLLFHLSPLLHFDIHSCFFLVSFLKTPRKRS